MNALEQCVSNGQREEQGTVQENSLWEGIPVRACTRSVNAIYKCVWRTVGQSGCRRGCVNE